MNRTTVLIILLFPGAKAQFQPSVTLNPNSRNYVVKYQGESGKIHEVYFEPSTKLMPFVTTNIFKSANSESLQFTYTIRNDASSLQRLQSFDIDLFSVVTNFREPNSHWRRGSYSFVRVFGWFNSNGEAGMPSPYDGVAPDSSETGFSFVSTGLPAIVNGYFAGSTSIVLAFPEEPPVEVSKLLKPLRSFPNNSIIRRTIAPKDPPMPSNLTVFLDTLLSYTRQSAELGWLGRDRDNDCDNDERPEDGIVRNIEQRLKKAQRQLERRDSVLARRELEKLVSKVERLWKRSEDNEERKHGKDRKNWWRRDKGESVVMTSEAYALLKYNTEYLIDRLPDRKPKKGSKDKD